MNPRLIYEGRTCDMFNPSEVDCLCRTAQLHHINNCILFLDKQKDVFFQYLLFVHLLVGFDYVAHLPQMCL